MTDYLGTLPDHDIDLLLTVHDDGTPEVRVRPANADAWTMWQPPVVLTREALPAAARRTREPGRCACGQPSCSDAGMAR